MKVSLSLPLPPSKNKRLGVANGRFYITKEIKDYYELVCQIVNYEYQIKKYFTKEAKIVIWCNWFVRRNNQDVVNFHDVICDALEKALEINDKFFLIRDLDKVVDKENARVDLILEYLDS